MTCSELIIFVFVSDPRQNNYFFFFYRQLLQSGAPLLGLANIIFILVQFFGGVFTKQLFHSPLSLLVSIFLGCFSKTIHSRLLDMSWDDRSTRHYAPRSFIVTNTAFSTSVKSIFARAQITSLGVVTYCIIITLICFNGTLIYI